MSLRDDALEFWYDHFGKLVAPESAFVGALTPGRRCERCSSASRVVARGGEAICLRCLSLSQNYAMLSKPDKVMRLGGKDTVVILTLERARVIGDVNFSNAQIEVTPLGETVRPKRIIADFFLYEAAPPYLVAMLGKADTSDTFRVSTTPAIGYLCGQEPLRVDLRLFRAAHAAVRDFPLAAWRRASEFEREWRVRPADGPRRSPAGETRRKLRHDLDEVYSAHPGLCEATAQLPLVGSDEYELLRWAFIEAKKA